MDQAVPGDEGGGVHSAATAGSGQGPSSQKKEVEEKIAGLQSATRLALRARRFDPKKKSPRQLHELLPGRTGGFSKTKHYLIVKKTVERRRQRSEAKYNRMYRSYISGLENRQGHIMRLMSDLINLTDEKYRAKHSVIYEQWRVQVYEFIQRQIEDKLDEMSPDYIKDKLRWFHYQYMSIANKQMVMRDCPRPDYDPFEPLKHNIKFSTKDLIDPVKHDLTKENGEKRFMGEFVSDKAVTKETLDLKFWPETNFRNQSGGISTRTSLTDPRSLSRYQANCIPTTFCTTRSSSATNMSEPSSRKGNM